jgi:hypothetical protein
MLSWIRRHQGTLTFGLSVLILLLVVLNALKHGVLTSAWLTTNKDAISALNNIASMTVLLAASIFSYFRFFRGRTLALRAELTIAVTVHATSENFLVHAITLSAKNVGSVTIWNPLPQISIDVLGPDQVRLSTRIDDWSLELSRTDDMIPVIEPGETVTFSALRNIDKVAWAVMYAATLRADQGDTWHTSKLISNVERTKDA